MLKCNNFYLFVSKCLNTTPCFFQKRYFRRKKDTIDWLQFKQSRENIEIARKYIESIPNISSLEDLHKLTWRGFREASRGREILKRFENSVPLMLLSVYPDYNWKLWKFRGTPSHFFQEPLILRRTLDQIGKELGVKTWEDWYDVKRVDFQKHFKRRMGSLYSLLSKGYPDYPWNVRRFRTLPRHFLIENLPQLFRDAAKELKLEKLEDWYSVSVKQISAMGLKTATDKIGLLKALQIAYPDFQWDKSLLLNHWKTERLIFSYAQDLFPNQEILFQHPLENQRLDVFVPELKIAFEYQGEQHYRKTDIFGLTPSENDSRKKKLCYQLGITLIEIPYWWDCRIESLRAHIHKHRKDVIKDSGGFLSIPDYPSARKQGEKKGTKRLN